MTMAVAVLEGEIVEKLTFDEARELTDEIKHGWDALWQLIIEAYNGRADEVLGYKNWDSYVKAEFPALPRMESPADRKEIVATLLEGTEPRRKGNEGMSQREIASTLGVDHQTVGNDLKGDGENSPLQSCGVPAQQVSTVMTDEDEYPVSCSGSESPEAGIKFVRKYLSNMIGMPMRPKDRDKLKKMLEQMINKLEERQ